MRSEFKKVARRIVPGRYELLSDVGQLRDNAIARDNAVDVSRIKDGIRDLLHKGKYLRGGVDDQVIF